MEKIPYSKELSVLALVLIALAVFLSKWEGVQAAATEGLLGTESWGMPRRARGTDGSVYRC